MKPSQPAKFDLSAARSLEGRVWDLLGQNNIQQAIASCEQLNKQFPDFASGWHTASQLAMKLKNPPLALTAIEKALSIEPNGTVWLLQKASCLAKLGDVEQLEAVVEQLSSRNMDTAYQCSAMGMLLTRLGRRERAVQHYEKAAALKPDEARHFFNIACLQRTLGDIEAAEGNFDKTISLDPSDFESYKIRSELRTQTPENNHVVPLEQLMEKGMSLLMRLVLF